MRIKSGEYLIDSTSWFDIRLTDMGVAINLCDQDANIRYMIVVDNGNVVFREVDQLIAD